jgi:hypothetical protein
MVEKIMTKHPEEGKAGAKAISPTTSISGGTGVKLWSRGGMSFDFARSS